MSPASPRVAARAFGWPDILRLGLVQAMIGAVVVLTTSTLNRVMVVELALPALLPGLLVGLHQAVQLSRPRMGYGSDLRRRRTPWIAGGMGVLALGGFAAAAATAWMGREPGWAIALAVLAFMAVGFGVSACGTSLLALLAKRVEPSRRASAAALVWVMMIMGLASTAGIAGSFLDPYSPARLVAVSAVVSMVALVVTGLALWRLEGDGGNVATGDRAGAEPFGQALRSIWHDAQARRFTVFVFVSMIAYSAQDLILEPFAGVAYGFTAGETTRLSGLQHGGSLLGMLLAAGAGRRLAGVPLGSLRAWTVWGCLASAAALAVLALAGLAGWSDWPVRANVFALGAANGAFSIAAIGSMMALAGRHGSGREGTRMGVWGASQAIAFASGGFLGALGSDLARIWLAAPGSAYAAVFVVEALLFVVAARLAVAVDLPRAQGAAAEPVLPRLATAPERGT